MSEAVAISVVLNTSAFGDAEQLRPEKNVPEAVRNSSGGAKIMSELETDDLPIPISVVVHPAVNVDALLERINVRRELRQSCVLGGDLIMAFEVEM